MSLELLASVGRGGENRPLDVGSLKSRLIALGFTWLTEDSSVNEPLINVINLLQSIKAGRDVIRGDGRVDVPGSTFEWLRAANAPRWQLMPAGSTAEGFVNIERADETDQHDFGTGWMADTIQAAGAYYRDQYLSNHPNAALLTVNDVSLPQGGDTPDHGGHETGLTCDLRLPRKDGTAPGNTKHTDIEIYDQDAMRAMLSAVRAQPLTETILFNDPDLVSAGLCQRAAGHDDHVHFELKPLVPVVDYNEPISDLLEQAITFFRGHVVDPTNYPLTQAGFQSYLADTGVQHFSAGEMLEPNHPEEARHLGYALFLPPHDWWSRGAALGLLSDELRRTVDEPVAMRNWWRPRAYNAAVDGGEDSDHITAHGVDLDYRSADSRRTAERRLRDLYGNEDWLQLSLGLGNQTTHVGILSPGRKRDWFYDSYVP